jgi:hypothetical protein
MNLWNFNAFFCIACIVMFYINAARAERLMKERYPELHFRETSFITGVYTAIKICIVSICPILNLALLYVLIFRDREMIESAVKHAFDEYHKNDHSEVT